MSSNKTYGGPSGANNSTIEYAENALISGVAGKKVFVVGSDGNQISPTQPSDIQMSEMIPMLRAILTAIANPSYVDKSANAIRNQVQSGTITTVTTVTTLTNVGTWPGGQLSFTASQNTWANMCRSLIT